MRVIKIHFPKVKYLYNLILNLDSKTFNKAMSSQLIQVGSLIIYQIKISYICFYYQGYKILGKTTKSNSALLISVKF